tara:strand:+ start:138 stop:509 length:372 start_codon:yes stop_codon:yes gene_type:complete
MLFVYVVALLSSLLLGFSLRSFWTGVLGLFIVLSSCDFAVYHSAQNQYVGPVLAVEALVEVVEILEDFALAKKQEFQQDMEEILFIENYRNNCYDMNIRSTKSSPKGLFYFCKEEAKKAYKKK